MVTEVVLVRHGETEWSRDRRHTSRTELPLTQRGESAARSLAPVLRGWTFSEAFSSPRQRALVTASLALPGVDPTVDDDLVEWDYGKYEGITTLAIQADDDPTWDLWTDGAVGGESPDDVAVRADRFIERVLEVDGTVVVFSHGHFLRVLGARWLGLDAEHGARFLLDTATVSVLGWERSRRVFERWNAASSGAPD